MDEQPVGDPMDRWRQIQRGDPCCNGGDVKRQSLRLPHIDADDRPPVDRGGNAQRTALRQIFKAGDHRRIRRQTVAVGSGGGTPINVRHA